MKNEIIIFLLNIWRLVGSYFLLLIIGTSKRHLIMSECKYWGKCCNLKCQNSIILFGYIMSRYKEYRSLFKYRICNGKRILRVVCKILTCLFPTMDSLQIHCPQIGSNLFIQHGFATVIAAREIGNNCWINQQVTIGYSFDEFPPIIGNGVRISAGAKILGDIRIEDNAIIGANAVVVKDVETNSIMAGVPAMQIPLRRHADSANSGMTFPE